MYHGKKQRFDWTFALHVTDLVMLVVSLALAWVILGDFSPETPRPPILTFLAYFILIIYVFRGMELYSWVAFTTPWRASFRVAVGLFLSALIFTGCQYLFGTQNPRTYERWILIQGIAGVVTIGLSRALVRYILMDRLRLVPVERIAFSGWGVRMETVLRALAHEMGSFQEMVGFFHTAENPEYDLAFEKGYHPLGALDSVERLLVEKNISLLIVDESAVSLKELQKLGEICARCFINLKIIPNAFDIWSSKLSLRIVAGIPLMGVYALRYDQFHNQLAKRVLDILGGLAGLLLSAPIIAVMAVLIKRESPGPIFFRQVRLGIHGKPFEIIKLRSMRLDAEKQTGAVWAVQDDPRRLKIGTFMRRLNIDELPQFWNVLKGEMSLVGPRPERPEFVDGFKETIRYYNLRHSCKPGVTGWAAVHGLRGDTSLENRLEYDLFYIENWSIMLDIRIMLMTLAPPKNAY